MIKKAQGEPYHLLQLPERKLWKGHLPHEKHWILGKIPALKGWLDTESGYPRNSENLKRSVDVAPGDKVWWRTW